MSDQIKLSVGDWIVHQHYGPGKIVGQEEKTLNSEKITYFRVETEDAEFWLPITKIHNERIRPVAGEKTIKKTIKILQSEAAEMDDDYKIRASRIKDVLIDGGLEPVSYLIRDLRCRQMLKKLTMKETRSLEQLEKRLLSEWSISLGIEMDEAQSRLISITQAQAEKLQQG